MAEKLQVQVYRWSRGGKRPPRVGLCVASANSSGYLGELCEVNLKLALCLWIMDALYFLHAF